VSSLPPRLAGSLDAARTEINIRTDDVAGTLKELMAWAGPHHLSLDGLEVGPPSLEDAYLAITGNQEPR
jgi:hypothetical protein